MCATVFEFVGGEPSPDSPFLSGVDGVVPAQVEDGAGVAEFAGGVDGSFSDASVWQILGEENIGQPLTGNLTRGVYGEQEFAVSVVIAKHMKSSVGGNRR